MHETKVSALLKILDDLAVKYPEASPTRDGWVRLPRESLDGALCAIITMAMCSEEIAQLVTGKRESDAAFMNDAKTALSWYLTNVTRMGHTPKGRATTLDIAFPTASGVAYALRMRYETNEWYEPGKL